MFQINHLLKNKPKILYSIIGLAGVVFMSFKFRALQKNNQKIDLKKDDDLSKEFGQAAKHARTFKGLTQDQQLTLYALYKQVTVGDCTIQKPSAIDLIKKTRWEAWKLQQGMSKQEAIEKYIVYVVSLGQHLKKKTKNTDITELADNTENQDQNINGFGFKVSTISQQQGDNQDFIDKFKIQDNRNHPLSQLDQSDEQNFHELDNMIKQYQNELLKDKVKNTANINKLILNLNESGISLLHQSIDKQNYEAFETLLPLYKADKIIDIKDSIITQILLIQDVGGMTPLHYAIIIEDEFIIDNLLQNGADPLIKDLTGETGLESASQNIKKLINKYVN